MNVDLLFVGDSITYGMELEPEHETYRFSHLVAKEKNLIYSNRSLSGACNDWIVKTAVNFFREGNACETAIIQFSAEERWIFHDPKLKRFLNMGNAKTTNNFFTKHMRPAHTAYYKYIYTHELAIENYWKNVFFLNEYLKGKCKTIYLSLTGGATGKASLPPRNEWTPDVEIGSVKLIVGDSRLVGHPSKEGHRKIAKYILRKL